MKRYEGLFILNPSGKDDGIKETIDKISAEITALGGNVETVQKMDRRQFMRIANKRHNSGYYVNFIFHSQPSAVAQLRNRLAMNPDVFRVVFTTAPEPEPAKT